MIRTRGSRWTLGRVLGKALGRQVSGDAEEAPQRRRSTTSARRQRTITVVAEDVDHVDHVTDEVHELPQEPVTDHISADTEGFSGRFHDTSVLTSYADHVATRVWAGEVVICLIISYFNNYLSFYLK